MISDSMEEKIKAVVEGCRPMLQQDGGDVDYVSTDDQNRVHLKLRGACGGCPMAVMTLKMGIERYIKDAVPEVTEVVQDA